MERITPTLLSWASILEDKTRAQAVATAGMPFIHPHMALMPDAHLGMGATVGSVIPTRGAIMPAAVGVDIGCGMDAVLTQWTGEQMHAVGYRQHDPAHPLAALREQIASLIPLSAGNYNTMLRDEDTCARADRLADLWDVSAESHRGGSPLERYAKNWDLQLGSLGSGNHFIEVSVDEDDRVWLFLHSGSRGVGNKIAQRHIRVAQDLAKRWWIDLPDRDLAYLVEGTDEFWTYIREMRWAQDFARENRAEMMDRVADACAWFMGEPVQRAEHVSCHHNYTEQERHGGKDVWLSRKGAIDATEGRLGLIPGSMGAASYVVEGKGNRAALNSAPHGAGREFSRRAARERFTLEGLAGRMAGIEWSGSGEFLDEHPDAYKDIDVVMADAKDLVEIRHTLRQLVSVKGD